MEHNAFLPRAYRTFDRAALSAKIRRLDGIMDRLPADLEELRREVQAARQRLFDELCRRNRAVGLESEADEAVRRTAVARWSPPL